MTPDAGYSDKPLAQKLGFSPGDSIYVEDTPDWYSSFSDDNGLDESPSLPATHVHLFCDSKVVLVDFLKHNDLKEIQKSLWVSWPKKSSGIITDINEQTLRELILPLGWVDTKVAAIDDKWSGLKFLRRKSAD